jgi:hypothetical protein
LVRLLSIECAHPTRTASLGQFFAVADALVPYLTPKEAGTLWDRLKAAPCFAKLDDSRRDWVSLFATISERNAAGMARQAEAMLVKDGAARRDYLLAVAVIGRLTAGERDRAVALWRQHAKGVSSDRLNVLPELLEGHLFPVTASHPR